MEFTKDVMAKTLLELRQLRAEVNSLRHNAREPIAVIGMGCRFPGGIDSPDGFWTALLEGRDLISPVPADRWDRDSWFNADPDCLGKVSTREGGFLDRIDLFDPLFFGISPLEAKHMDPQQRMVLEVSWEALERAGVAPEKLYGKSTGVFLGMCGFDYGMRMLEGQPAEQIDAFCGTGSGLSLAAGRLSYVLGLTGPSMVIDTACSSSLVCIHQACHSLRRGESTLALAGGVNMVLSVGLTLNFSRAHLLSPDGRCHTFDASAQGYGRAEGCGIVVLKRLSDAVRDGDRVWAVVRGSAVNQDGASGGLTVPSGPSQQDVIRTALKNADLLPNQIEYVEAHGTGTVLGDPIEMGALKAVFAEGRERPLYIGSVKTNMGHLEAAAGIASFIKTVLILNHAIVPPNLHFQTPNPHIDWSGFPATIAVKPTSLGEATQVLRAGVSGFGFGGTNAHLVLESAPAQAQVKPLVRRHELHVLALSAKSPAALDALNQRYQEFLESDDSQAWGDICHTAATGRSHFDYRLAVTAFSKADAAIALKEAKPEGPAQLPQTALLFGEDHAEQNQLEELLKDSDYLDTLNRCAAALEGFTSESLHALLMGQGRHFHEEATPRALVAYVLGVAHFEKWKKLGLQPDAVVGYGVGELPAGYAAGLYTLEEGLALTGPERAKVLGEIHLKPALRPFLSARSGELVANLDSQFATVPEPGSLNLLNALDHVKGSVLLCGSPSLVHLGQALRPQASWLSVANFRELNDALVQLFQQGLNPNWQSLFGPDQGPRALLPTYAFQRDRYWLEAPVPPTPSLAAAQNGPAFDGDEMVQKLRDSNVLNPAERLLVPKLTRLMTRQMEGPEAENCYSLHWKELSAPEPAEPGTGLWLILADRGGEAAKLVTELSFLGQATHLVFGDEPMPDRATLQGLTGLVDLRPLDLSGGAWESGVATLCEAVKSAREGVGKDLPMWVMTRSAYHPVAAEAAANPVAMTLWGLGRVLALKQRDVRFTMIDLDAEVAMRDLAVQLLAKDDEEQVLLHHGQRYGARLLRQQVPTKTAKSFSPDGTYLITGGLGMLSLKLAQWLADAGVRRLVLTSRSGHEPGQSTYAARQVVLDELADAGVEVLIHKVHAEDAAGMNALFQTIDTLPGSLKGVFHLAGHVEKLEAGVAASFAKDMAAKAKGAWLLHELTQDRDLDWFVCFSSVTAIWGDEGHGSYAASNAYLDGLCHFRHGQGLPALALDWGYMGHGGMVDQRMGERFAAYGMPRTEAYRGFDLMAKFANDLAQVQISNVVWPLFLKFYNGGRDRSLHRDLKLDFSQDASGTEDLQTNEAANLRSLLLGANELQKGELLAAYACELVSQTLRLDKTKLLVEAPLMSLGLNSLLAAHITNRVRTDLDTDVPLTLLLRDASSASLGRWLTEHVQLATSDAAATTQGSVLDHLDLSSGLQVEDASHLLANLDQLSDEEAARLLASLQEEEEW